MSSLINRSAVKQHIKDKFLKERPHMGISRVSDRAVNQIEAKIRHLIHESIKKYPSVGKTYMDFF